jgi:hypothetical protein
MSIHPEGKPCSDLGRVLVLKLNLLHLLLPPLCVCMSIDPAGKSCSDVVQCLFSMTLLKGSLVKHAQTKYDKALGVQTKKEENHAAHTEEYKLAVGPCRLTVSKPVFEAPRVSALESMIS